MQIFHDLNEWRRLRHSLSSTRSLGLVATMGNLHKGHVSLLKVSQQENDLTVATIFVNPTQFNRPDDFTLYPRTLENDLALLSANGVDYCLLPNEQAMYEDSYCYQIQESKLCQLMEGRKRPGHFAGVLTVVMKLFNLTQPHCAYFGEKDYQQYLLIRGMVATFFMNIKIKACPTIRENSLLPFSSRNNRLNLEQRILADRFSEIFHQDKCSTVLKAELLEAGIDVEYIEEYEGRRYVAVMIGNVRLIDNYVTSQ